MACSQNRDGYLGGRYRRIASRRGPLKANVAIQHSMLLAIWHMGTTGELYNDPGGDYFTRLHRPTAPKSEQSTNSKPWATTSLQPPHPENPRWLSESSRLQTGGNVADRVAGYARQTRDHSLSRFAWTVLMTSSRVIRAPWMSA